MAKLDICRAKQWHSQIQCEDSK